MDESTKNKAKGTWEEAKGKAKEAAGDVTADTSMQAEGQADELKGKARKQFGEFQGKLDDLTDDDKRDKPS